MPVSTSGCDGNAVRFSSLPDPRLSTALPFMAANRYNRDPFAPVRPLIWTKIRDLHRQHHHAIRG